METLFDYQKACELRDIGLSKAEANNFDWVQQARSLAIHLAMKNGEVDSDQVQAILPRPPSVSPNAAGAVFRCKQLVCVGFKQSSRVSAHARTIKVFKYVGDNSTIPGY
jgi:hypothetical protein